MRPGVRFNRQLWQLPILHFFLTIHRQLPSIFVTSLRPVPTFRPLLPGGRSRPFRGPASGSSSSSTTSMKTSLEVEQKFRISPPAGGPGAGSSLTSRLEGLGFVCTGTKSFADWYFDSASIELSLKDWWLRCRVMTGERGVWQLKRGRRTDAGAPSATTIYEEIEGMEAVDVAVSALGGEAASFGDVNLVLGTMIDGHEVPFLPTDKPHDLLPFCRLETIRTSWVPRSGDSRHDACASLQVDLDTTNTGYAVGEVEIVVNSDDEVRNATAKVKFIIDQLLEGQEGETGPPIGKLEHFLENHRPWHYDACKKRGVLK